jgi:hypothetical protein
MTMTVTNNGDSPLRLGEFNTAGVRFMDAAVAQDESGRGLAPKGEPRREAQRGLEGA